MNAAQETQEKRPELFEKIDRTYSVNGGPLYRMDIIRCPCARGWHVLHDDFENKPLRIYDYAFIKHPIGFSRIVIAFLWQGEHHRAIMPYNIETHRLLEKFDEKFKQGFGVLLTPYWLITPKSQYPRLKPAV